MKKNNRWTKLTTYVTIIDLMIAATIIAFMFCLLIVVL